jgi:hypothetical protein
MRREGGDPVNAATPSKAASQSSQNDAMTLFLILFISYKESLK